jgi:hypothetical protein
VRAKVLPSLLNDMRGIEPKKAEIMVGKSFEFITKEQYEQKQSSYLFNPKDSDNIFVIDNFSGDEHMLAGFYIHKSNLLFKKDIIKKLIE